MPIDRYPRRTFLRRGLAGVALAGAGVNVGLAHDRPYGPSQKTRSAVAGRRGVAATSQPMATAAAMHILRRGGNAIDAAIAASAVLGVVEPMSCGIGGDLFAIIWDSRAKTLLGLNASGRSPGRADLAGFRDRGLSRIPAAGPLSWSVPGCVDGWDEMRRKLGTLAWGDLLEPAIEYAEDGFVVAEILAGDWRAVSRALARVPTSSACFLPGGRSPEAGDVFQNPDLARSLRAIVDGGRDGFYKGPIADEIVKYSEAVGGLFAADDFAGHTSQWVEPVSTSYRGYDVWELPPNGQGIAVLQMLNLLEGYDLRSMGPNSAQALHLMIEAKKLAYEDRARYYADPEKVAVPTDWLISKAYAESRRKFINPDRASETPAPGEMQGETAYLTVVDGLFNAVSLIQSNYNGFGSGHVPGDLGFALQNRGSSFALDPGHANRLEPRKRPFHTIIPAFVTKGGAPWLSFGLMGGDMQAQGHAQMVCNMIDFDMDVQQAGDAPRFRHYGSSDPTGTPADGGGKTALESEIGPEVRAALEAKGHRLRQARNGFGGYQAVRIDVDRGVLTGGSDPRKDGQAMGF